MKMIITCRRNPRLSRPEFFNHLRHVHWPLIQRYPDVLENLKGYTQNHALGGGAGGAALTAPFAVAGDRDSVIELVFDGEEGLHRVVGAPDYQAHVRPDESRFNDLPANLMVKTDPETLFETAGPGRCKRIDFIARRAECSAERFASALAEQGRQLALDPFYTAHVDKHVHNLARAGVDLDGFGRGNFDCVREVWGRGFDMLSAVAGVSRVPDADTDRSFSVYATEFVMKA
jgi:hypothetical protein